MRKSELRKLIREIIEQEEDPNVQGTGVDSEGNPIDNEKDEKDKQEEPLADFCLTLKQQVGDKIFQEKILELNDDALMEDYIDVLIRTFGDQQCQGDDQYEPPQKTKSKGKNYKDIWRKYSKKATDIDYLGMEPTVVKRQYKTDL